MNINLKIEAKNGCSYQGRIFYVLPVKKSLELKMIYTTFEDCFILPYKMQKLSKRARRGLI